MAEMRGEERWAKACIEAALAGVKALQCDDGSRPSMYDLDLLRAEEPFGACEVTAAADAESIELWNIVNGSGERWTEPELMGGWIITVTPRCRANRLKKELPGLLWILENESAGSEREDVAQRLQELDIVSTYRGGTDYPGSIYITVQRLEECTGDIVPSTGNSLVTWLDAWMREPAQHHNVEKLRSADRVERHLFVLLPGFTTAPFSASDLLMRTNAPLPEIAPTMPEGITHLWLMSTWDSGDVFHWAPGGWQRFSKVLADLEP